MITSKTGIRTGFGESFRKPQEKPRVWGEVARLRREKFFFSKKLKLVEIPFSCILSPASL